MTRTAAARETARTEALFAWMEAIGDPTRLRALRALERQELSVLELCEALALPQSTVSRHLKVLADGGWVTARREGTQAFYAWAAELDPGARKLWTVARAESEGWPVVRQDADRLAAVRARRGGAQKFFAGAAGAWDGLRAQVYGRGFGVEALLALVPPAWTVADLGCGTGALTAELAPRVRRVVAVDQSAAMLRAARKRAADLPNVTFHEADLAALPLEDASVDAALLVLVLAYLELPEAALREAARVVRPGGRLVVLDAARHLDEGLRRRMGQARPGFTPDELERLVEHAGFHPSPVRTLPPEPGAKGPGLVVCAAERLATQELGSEKR
ncbi:MAG: metalloregulator ArsR/SmtB family transcription factor [Anaeromyxobacter sp.]